MAMSSQFSLSLELSKLVPFGSLVNATGHGLVRLLRQIQASGSDFVTEQDLAEVFGRNRVEPLFASTFRTAVKQSLIHEISGIAELVIEGGAGPTVRRSLNEPGYFAMVVQLSLLTYTHALSDLTRSLTKSFEQRAQGAPEYVAPPRYDNLMGALRAIREQTCGFMWELVISAIESKLYPSIVWTDGTLYTRRTVPQTILQGLLDSFTAVQHLPENTRLRIRSCWGVPTIIVWAHQILGLTVHVNMVDETIAFGDGLPTVWIDAVTRGSPISPDIALLNETDDVLFHTAETSQKVRLGPIYRHPVRDYGTRILRLRDDDLEREKGMVFAVVASCIEIARKQAIDRRSRPCVSGKEICFPSVRHVISVCRMVFASHADMIDAIDPASELPCPALQSDLDSSDPRCPSHYGGMKTLLYLTHVVLVLSLVQGVEDELTLSTDALAEILYNPFTLPNARGASQSLASLLISSNDHKEDPTLFDDSTSVVSAWGWCLCLGSMASRDPSDATTELTFVRGVPARGGERKVCIIDGAESIQGQMRRFRSMAYRHCTIVARPGEKCNLESWTSPEKSRYFVGTNAFAFEVSKVVACTSRLPSCSPIGKPSQHVDSLSLGFRSMQEILWDIVHIPACDHLAALGQSIILPEGVWAFEGFSINSSTDFPAEAVLAGLVAGDSSARWILVGNMYEWGLRRGFIRAIYVRNPECCFECAVQAAKSACSGQRIGLVL
ncbi:MAG: hypothetical protein L6R37_001836 [Teloschistes peruensis]|nr:MAG: hypothetical protein L6R37_001836 [Teloschistes peruensis]